MQIELPYSTKQALLDILRVHVPIDLRTFTGDIVISLKEEEIGVLKYSGHVRVNYVDNSK